MQLLKTIKLYGFTITVSSELFYLVFSLSPNWWIWGAEEKALQDAFFCRAHWFCPSLDWQAKTNAKKKIETRTDFKIILASFIKIICFNAGRAYTMRWKLMLANFPWSYWNVVNYLFRGLINLFFCSSTNFSKYKLGFLGCTPLRPEVRSLGQISYSLTVQHH